MDLDTRALAQSLGGRLELLVRNGSGAALRDVPGNRVDLDEPRFELGDSIHPLPHRLLIQIRYGSVDEARVNVHVLQEPETACHEIARVVGNRPIDAFGRSVEPNHAHVQKVQRPSNVAAKRPGTVGEDPQFGS